MYSTDEPRNQVGVVSVILGGLALATCWLLIGVPLGIAALLAGDIARRRASHGEATNPRAAIAGMVLGAVAIVAGVVAIGSFSGLDSEDRGFLQGSLDNPATNNC